MSVVGFRKVEKYLQPGTWAVTVKGLRGEFSVSAMCPNGHIGSLADHSVDDQGRVFPSVECPAEGCDFHSHVTLMDWDKPAYNMEAD